MGGFKYLVGVVVLGLGFSPLLAQNKEIVCPSGYAAKEGFSYTKIPFGRRGTVRLQQVYGENYFSQANLTLTAMAFRPDKDGLATLNTTVDVSLQVGVRKLGVLGLATSFAGNRPTVMKTVFPRQKISLPLQSPGSGPMPFSLSFLFNPPFVYDRTQGALFVETVVYDQPGSSHTWDITYLANSSQMGYGPQGCQGSNQMVPKVWSATSNVYWGEKLLLESYNLLSGAATLIMVGTKESGPWAGVNLPVDLAPFGASGCSFSVDMLIPSGGAANNMGRFSAPFTLPRQPLLLGQWIHFQAMAQDAKANALGFVFSRGHKVQVCGPEAMGRVYHFDLNATTGVFDLGIATVTKFTAK